MEKKYSISNKEIWAITMPIILGNLAQSLIAIIDTAFLGRLGEVELGASMMSSIYYFVWVTLPWGFAIGIQILIARRLGENRNDRIGVIFQHGIRIMLIFGLILFSLLYLLTPTILGKVISSPNILEASKQFMEYRIYGIIFVCSNYLCRYFFIGISNTKIITISTIVMAITNIILDYGLIFGKFGLPEMGISGAALASSISEFTGFLTFWIYLIFIFDNKKYSLFLYKKFETWLVGHLLKLSIPTMCQKLLGIGIWFIFFVFVENMGEESIAVSGIIRSLFMLIGVTIFAFGSTANTVVSRLMGEGKTKEVYNTIGRITMYSYLMIAPILLLCFICPDRLLSIYTDIESLKIASIETLNVLCIAMLFYVPGIIYFEAVSGTGNTKHALAIEIITLIFYSTGIYLLIYGLKVNVAGAWISEIIYGSVIFIISALYMWKYKWQETQI